MTLQTALHFPAMLNHPATKYLHSDPAAYWCADCWKFTLDCSHPVEPLTSPVMKLDNVEYSAATWQRNVLQVTMNTGERYQFFNVPRTFAARSPKSRQHSPWFSSMAALSTDWVGSVCALIRQDSSICAQGWTYGSRRMDM